MKLCKTPLLLALLVSPSLVAGTVTFSGTGRVPSAADYVELSITVSSECYETPSAARVQTDLRVSKIVELLKTKISTAQGSRDTVLASGGYSSPFSKTVYAADNTRHTVCEGTYQKSSVVTLKTTNVAGFAADFDDIQEKVLAQFKPAPSDTNSAKPVTYVSIGSPQPQLFHETTAAAEKTALALALQDATAKLEATFGSCPITSYHIVSYTDSAEQAREMPYAAEAARFSAPSATPVNFDDLWTRKTLKVQFEFEGGHCRVNAAHHHHHQKPAPKE